MSNKLIFNTYTISTERKKLNDGIPVLEKVNQEELPDLKAFLLPAVRLLAELLNDTVTEEHPM